MHRLATLLRGKVRQRIVFSKLVMLPAACAGGAVFVYAYSLLCFEYCPQGDTSTKGMYVCCCRHMACNCKLQTNLLCACARQLVLLASSGAISV